MNNNLNDYSSISLMSLSLHSFSLISTRLGSISDTFVPFAKRSLICCSDNVPVEEELVHLRF